MSCFGGERAGTGGRALPVVAIAVVGIVLGFGTSPGVAAQRPNPLETGLHAVSRRVDNVSPRSGRAGTVVTLKATGMPAITPVRIGLGATEVGFEEIGQALTTEKGELSLTVTIPSWTRPDLTHIFIVFDFYFVPIAVSDEFFVLAPDGTVVRQGRITNEVGDCSGLGLLTDQGVLYTLVGDLSGFEAGDRVIVEGGIAESTPCPQSATIARRIALTVMSARYSTSFFPISMVRSMGPNSTPLIEYKPALMRCSARILAGSVVAMIEE